MAMVMATTISSTDLDEHLLIHILGDGDLTSRLLLPSTCNKIDALYSSYKGILSEPLLGQYIDKMITMAMVMVTVKERLTMVLRCVPLRSR